MTQEAEPAGEVCIANIGPRERRKRMFFGLATIGIGVFFAAFLMESGASRWVRIATALPFWAGALGVFQAQAHT